LNPAHGPSGHGGGGGYQRVRRGKARVHYHHVDTLEGVWRVTTWPLGHDDKFNNTRRGKREWEREKEGENQQKSNTSGRVNGKGTAESYITSKELRKCPKRIRKRGKEEKTANNKENTRKPKEKKKNPRRSQEGMRGKKNGGAWGRKCCGSWGSQEKIKMGENRVLRLGVI